MLRKLSFILVLVFLSNVAIAQDFLPAGSFKVDVAVPVPLGNKAFKKTQNGLVNISAYYQHAFKGFTVGGGVRYNYFHVNEFALQERITGGLHQVGGFLKLGYERFVADKISIDFGIRGGYLQMFSKNSYSDSVLNGAYKKGTWFVEPMFHISYLASETSAFNFHIGYNVQFFNYTPDFLSIPEIPPFNAADNSKLTHFLTFGFGYSYFFGRKKKGGG